MAKRRESRIIEDIKHHFGFLFERGYQIRDVQYSQEAFWYMILESPNFFIRIDCDRDYISVLFDPEKRNGQNQIGLESLVYYLSKGKHFVGYFEGNPAWGRRKQFERLSGLLKEYHDQVASFFISDSYRFRDDWTISQKKYSELLSENYSQKFKAQQKLSARIILLLSPIALLFIVPWAYLAWGNGINFVTETNLTTKWVYGFISLFMILVLAIFINRMIKSLARCYRILKE